MSATDDGALLLAAILANPGCDTARLVYADWLDEQGTPAAGDRAEFVRVQVEIAEIGEPNSLFPKSMTYREREVIKLRYGLADYGYTYTLEEIGRIFKITRERVRQIEIKAAKRVDVGRLKEVGRLRGRGRVLLADWWDSPGWLPDVMLGRRAICWPGEECRPYEGGIRFAFRRGFVESLACDARSWLAHCAAILAAHPVTGVTITAVTDDDVRELANCIGDTEAEMRLLGTGATWNEWVEFWRAPDLKRAFEAEWPGVTFALPPT